VLARSGRSSIRYPGDGTIAAWIIAQDITRLACGLSASTRPIRCSRCRRSRKRPRGRSRQRLTGSTGRRAPDVSARDFEEEVAMKANYKIAAALIGSFVLGVGAASVLHAQGKPAAYVVAQIDVKDRDGFIKDFLPKTQANMKDFGGKYLAGGFDKAVSLTGAAPPNRVVLLQFPDMDTVKAFYEKQKPIEADIGSKYASFRIMAIEAAEPK
jgi:uncharacterized protein (DUF1330 family)